MSVTVTEPKQKPPEDMLYERVDGKFVQKRQMSALALFLTTQLTELINAFVKSKGLGRAVNEMVFILDVPRDLRRRPDVAFVSSELWPLNKLPPWHSDWPIVPELAVEIVSPGNSMNDLMREVSEYFRYGVHEVWIALPEERCVQCYAGPKSVRILDAADTLTTSLIPQWSLPIGDWLPQIPASETTE